MDHLEVKDCDFLEPHSDDTREIISSLKLAVIALRLKLKDLTQKNITKNDTKTKNEHVN